jgi:guanylate kinase
VASGLGFSRVVTSTTRSPREGEVDGTHYHFFTPAEFDARVAAGDFLEWAWVHGDRRYGTLASSIVEPLSRGMDLVLSVDVQGVASIRRAAGKLPVLGRALVTVFIVVERPRLLARIRRRGKDDEAEVARRMATAEKELREAPRFDYIIESRTRDEDFAALLAILEKARRRAAGGSSS